MSVTVTRRTTLGLIMAAGGLTLVYPRALATGQDEHLHFRSDGMSVPLVKIHADNSATIFNPNPDMGQGTSTGLPMMIAEELDLDWSSVQVEQLPLKRHRDAKGDLQHTYIAQASGGSGSIRRAWPVLPRFGAQGRDMFLRAASAEWKVPVSRLETKDSAVIDSETGKRLTYAGLLRRVSKLTPDPDVKVKNRDEYRLIGKPIRIKAAQKIVRGEPMFGMDMAVEGMAHAVIARCPHFCGSVASVNDIAARAVPGVIDVIPMAQSDKDGPLAWIFVAGVAVVADSFWAAKKARALLEIEWNAGPFAGYSSHKMEAESLDALEDASGFEVVEHDGQIRNEGDVEKALLDAAIVHDAKYTVAHVAHALMEPHSAIADVRADSVYMNVPCQHPYRVQNIAHQLTGIPHEKIKIDPSRSGGAFGRRWELDYPAEAIWLSKRLARVVKVTWTREDELAQDRFRNANNYRMTGGVDGNGRLFALRQRMAGGYPSLDPEKVPPIEWPYEDLMGWHFTMGMIDNHRFEQNFKPSPVPRGPWRAPGSVNSAFAQMSFLDEMAFKAGVDPLDFQLRVLGAPRFLPDGEKGPMAMHTGRMANCLRLAAQQANWTKELPTDWGRGIAGYFSHLSFVAHVIEVSFIDGNLIVERVITAADCGLVINPLGVRAQIEGAIHDGLSVALAQEITVENAAVMETNFDSYEMAKIDAAPRQIEIHLVESDEHPTGMGEPAMPPFAPALMNAIFSATGKRIRRLPIADQLQT